MLLTGVDERSCYRYAAGDVKPPAYFLRALLRSERGEAVLRYLMQGSDASWWRGLQDDAQLGARVKQLR